jgi:hypothetical protein
MNASIKEDTLSDKSKVFSVIVAGDTPQDFICIEADDEEGAGQIADAINAFGVRLVTSQT